MILFLRSLFLIVIASRVGVTSWAGQQQSLGDFARSATFRDPWVIATLFDAYWAFITFYVWVAWKEQSLPARMLWFVSIILLGNMAMAAYMLRELFSVPATGPLDQVFTRRNPGSVLLPALLTTASIVVYLPAEKAIWSADLSVVNPNALQTQAVKLTHALFTRLNLDYDTYIMMHTPNPDRPLTKADVVAVSQQPSVRWTYCWTQATNYLYGAQCAPAAAPVAP